MNIASLPSGRRPYAAGTTGACRAVRSCARAALLDLNLELAWNISLQRALFATRFVQIRIRYSSAVYVQRCACLATAATAVTPRARHRVIPSVAGAARYERAVLIPAFSLRDNSHMLSNAR